MHSQITYNRSIWQDKDWIVTRFRTFLFRKFVPQKRGEANNTMTNQQRDLLGLRVCWMFSNQYWCGFSLPTYRRGNNMFGPCLAGWYELYLTLLFAGRANWGPLSVNFRGVQELNLIFCGGSNGGPLGGALRVSTSSSPCFPNPSYLDFLLGFLYNFGITKLLVIIVNQGRGD